MKFAHLADCHIGGWRDPKMRSLSIKAFSKAVEKIIEENVDFVLISGDLFNTSMPNFEGLKETVLNLKKINEKNIKVYVVPGSHDFSPSGKTMLDVLENAGLFINVVKGSVEGDKLRLNFTTDEKTGAKITGMLGKKGMLEKTYFESLERANLENEKGFKIFMFHTAIDEFKPAEMANMESSPLSFLPRNFSYYAGGHVHYVFQKMIPDYGAITYPGPLFPNNFKELEELNNGGFFIFDNGKLMRKEIKTANVFSIKIDCNNKSSEQVQQEMFDSIKSKEFVDTVVTVRLNGMLSSGNISDIDFKEFFSKIYDKGAYFAMKNTMGASSKEFETINTDSSTVEDIEEKLINEHIGQTDLFDKEYEKEIIKTLMNSFDSEKNEGERNADFENRLKEDIKKILNL
jgi:hypothetical protein